MAIEDWLTKDYRYVTKGEQYIFIMLAPPQDEKGPKDEEREDPEIRKIYHESGLYRNDGSTTPLWTVDWYSTLVHVSSDGKYLAKLGPWPTYQDQKDFENGSPALEQLALAFYKERKLFKKYKIRDLIQNPKKLAKGRSHFQWKERIWFDDVSGRLNVITHDEQKLVFDIRSGKIVERI